MSKESVTVAGIDCGTNSIRLKIARVDADGMHEVVPRILRVIRLGQDVDKTHRFADEALERAYVAAREFAGVIAEHPIDGLRFVATSATRDAENREELEDEIERILGAATELVIGGDGVSAPTTQVQGAFSMNIGSVRMTERHLTNDPPTQTQIDEAVADVDEHIDEALRTVDAGKARTIIGVSGTVTTMTALAMGLKEYDHTVVDGHRLSLEDAYAVDDKFLRMTRAERREYKTIHPGRIDVVGGGAVVWSLVLTRVSEAAKADHGEAIDSFVASEHGLLDGIVLDYGRRLLAQ